jgi:uncharacterized protein (DUF849 family)
MVDCRQGRRVEGTERADSGIPVLSRRTPAQPRRNHSQDLSADRRTSRSEPYTAPRERPSTGAAPDSASRFRAVASWTELPDLVTANQGEVGIVELCELLTSRGVGIEAGLLSLEDAPAFVAAGVASRCVRVMVEPLDADPDAAVAHAATIEQLVTGAGIALEQVHHGDHIASWAVNRRAVPLGHGIRTGLEDTPVLPDGRQAHDNADLVAAAAAMLGR